MKIFVAHSSQIDFQNKLYTPLRESKLNTEHEIFLPHENGREVNTKEEIRSSNCIVAEVSFPSMGEGIELGWAETFEKPIICFYKEGTQYSKWLKMISKVFIQYKDSQDLVNLLEKELEKI